MSYWNYGSNKIDCPDCGKEFQPAYGVHQVYCSKACKQRAYRRRHNGRYVADQERNTGAVTLHQVESNTSE